MAPKSSRKSAVKRTKPAKKPKAASKSAKPSQKQWPTEVLLREASVRMRQLKKRTKAATAKMIAGLLMEAGWSEAEFLDALIVDVSEGGEGG
jgi:hypothetical protein